MIFQRFEDDGLAHYSYAVGDEETRELAIVDPRRDVDPYLDFARRHGLRVAHVLETHVHADYASGAFELARRAGAQLHLSAYDDGERFDVSFPHQELREGDEIGLGRVRLRVVHTPGHTPEHVSFLVHDGPGDPVRFLTGDFLFIGSLGRPDLLGEDARDALAAELFRSVRRVLPGLPGGLRINPAHGSGSMCGGGMSSAPERTLGEERIHNPFLAPDLDRDAFVRRLLETLPPYPDYYRRMKDRNAGGTGFDRAWPSPVALGARGFRDRANDGAAVLDTRDPAAFGGAHIPGSYGIGLGPDLSEWAGWVAPYDRPLLLVLPAADRLQDALTRLARVGLDRVVAYLDGGIDAWAREALPLGSLPWVEPRTLRDRIQPAAGRGAAPPATGPAHLLVDVRTRDEWEDGHVAGALHVPAGEIQDRLDEIRDAVDGLPDADPGIALACSTGYRSTVAASVLLRNGFTRVSNVAGGMTAWRAADLPLAPD